MRSTVLAAASGRRSRTNPVGRFIAGSRESARDRQRFPPARSGGRTWSSQSPDSRRKDLTQNPTGQMRHPDPGQNQESRIVGDPMQPLLLLKRTPSDELVAGAALPGRRSKHDAGQQPSRFCRDGVLEILAYRAAPAQIVKLRQGRGALLLRVPGPCGLPAPSAVPDPAAWLPPARIVHSKFNRAGRTIRFVGVWRRAGSWIRPRVFQLHQQGPRRHVL